MNISDREYFKQIMARASLLFLMKLKVNLRGEPIFVVASPVKKDGKITGVIGTSVQLKAMAKKITDPVKVCKRICLCA